METLISPFMENKYKHLKAYLESKNAMVAPTGLLTRTDKKGFIAILTEKVFDDRKIAKDMMLDLKKIVKSISDSDERFRMESEIAALNMKQNALKVLGNAFFGVTGLKFFRYFNLDIAKTITFTGQCYLKLMIKKINFIMNRVLNTSGIDYAYYGDTDSIFFRCDTLVEKFCKNKTEKEIVSYLEKFVKTIVQVEMNNQLKEIADQINVPVNRMFFKLEGIANNSIWLAKKRYISNLLYNEGVWYDPPEMKIMGMEIVRSSTPKFIKEQLKKAVDICINGTEQELQDFVAKEKEIFMKKDVEDISFPRGCNGLGVYSDPDTIYKKRTPVAVRGALLHNHLIKEKGLSSKIQQIGDGERVRFVYLKLPNPIHENVISYVNKLPPEFNVRNFIDRNTMFEKGFIKPLEGVLSAIHWNWEEKNLLDL